MTWRNIVRLLMIGTFAFNFMAFPLQAKEISEEENKKQLEKVAQEIIFSILDRDVDALMEMTNLEGGFLSQKEGVIKSTLLSGYYPKNLTVNEIEVTRTKIEKKGDKAKVMVKVHFTSSDVAGGLATAPIARVWNFIKGKEDKQKGAWILDL